MFLKLIAERYDFDLIVFREKSVFGDKLGPKETQHLFLPLSDKNRGNSSTFDVILRKGQESAVTFLSCT